MKQIKCSYLRKLGGLYVGVSCTIFNNILYDIQYEKFPYKNSKTVYNVKSCK